MRLQRIVIHRLTRILAGILPAVVAVLIAIPAWNYWTRTRDARPRVEQQPGEFPSDLAIHTDGFSITRNENGKPLFAIRAEETMGYQDNRMVLKNVEVDIYPKQEGDPIRHIRSAECTYDQKSDDILCTRDVTVQLDDNTFAYMEQVTYQREASLISSGFRTRFEQPGEMKGAAGRFDYFLDSGLLRLVDNVSIDLTQGESLRAGVAVFQRNESWATVSQGVELKSANGWVRGGSGRADLQPGSYRPTRITVESGVTAESYAQKGADAWKLRSDWLQSDLSGEGNVEHMLAKGSAHAERKSAEGEETLKGSEIEAHFDSVGHVHSIEARQNPEFNAGERQLTADNKIVINAEREVKTEGRSTLTAGSSAVIEGRDFSIEQTADIRVFKTQSRAKLTSGARTTEADRTTVRFDAQTNQLRELEQEGNFTFEEGARTGHAGRARVLNGGDIVILEDKPQITNEKTTTLNALKITLNQKDNSFVGDKEVLMTDVRSKDQPIRVTAGKVEGRSENFEYWDHVEFYRGDSKIEADHILASTSDKGLRADGNVKTQMGEELRVSAQTMDYSDAKQNAHYAGKVWARKRDKQGVFELTTDEMDVRLKQGEGVDVIEAKGSVVITQGLRRCTAAEAVYREATGQITLTGSETTNAECTDKENGEITGYRMNMNRDGKAVVVEPAPNGRVTSRPNIKK